MYDWGLHGGLPPGTMKVNLEKARLHLYARNDAVELVLRKLVELEKTRGQLLYYREYLPYDIISRNLLKAVEYRLLVYARHLEYLLDIDDLKVTAPYLEGAQARGY